MSDVKETLKVEPIEAGEYDREALEGMVRIDVNEFESFFMSMRNGPLTDYERLIVQTYLMYKLGVRMKDS